MAGTPVSNDTRNSPIWNVVLSIKRKKAQLNKQIIVKGQYSTDAEHSNRFAATKISLHYFLAHFISRIWRV